jgi:hypothetical protein
MVSGITGNRMKFIRKMKKKKLKKGENIKRIIFEKLKEEIYDDNEYRLYLWMPLSLEEKLDMIMHQRVEDEMEIMIFLLDEEYKLSDNMTEAEHVYEKIERALD